ncbi:MAG: hypothetical protein PW734_09240 [Verrucomicrobium sp.]|nr:hypothetical protein [Verrucomicrobium sp.]
MEARIDPDKAPFLSLYPQPLSQLHPELSRFVQSLPKTESHFHLEGALPLPLLQQLDLPIFDGFFGGTPPYADRNFRFRNFTQFARDYKEHSRAWFTSPERYAEAAAMVLADLRRHNVRYVELSIGMKDASYDAEKGRCVPGRLPAIIDAVHAAAKAMEPDITTRIYATMRRKDYEGYSEIIEETIRHPKLFGIDLSGSEARPIEPWTSDVWSRARDVYGKKLKAHAGEFHKRPESAKAVRHAIEELGVCQVEHGIAAVHHPELIDLIKQKDITLGTCPQSNYKLHAVKTLHDHPIKDLMKEGVRCTVNSDDPFYFGGINDVYVALATQTGLSKSELAELALNGFQAAHLAPEEKAAPMAELRRIIERERQAEDAALQRKAALQNAPFPSRTPASGPSQGPDRRASQEPTKS